MSLYGRGKGAPRADGGRRKEEKEGRKEGRKGGRRSETELQYIQRLRFDSMRRGAVRCGAPSKKRAQEARWELRASAASAYAIEIEQWTDG